MQQNKHGPRDDLMQAVMKGSGKRYTVVCSYRLVPVIKPPGKGYGCVLPHIMRVTDRLKLLTVDKRPRYGIAFGLPVMSHSGKPVNPPFFLTRKPVALATVKHKALDVMGGVCVRRSAFGVQRLAFSVQRSAISYQL